MQTSSLLDPLLTVGLPSLTALVWAALAQSYCRCHGTARPEGALLSLFRGMGWLFAGHYAAKAVIALYPPDAAGQVFVIACLTAELTIIIVLPLMRHIIRLGTLGVPAPGRLWLAINYGFALLALPSVDPRPGHGLDVFSIYLVGLATLILWDLVRLARGRRRPILMADLGFRGFLGLAIVLFAGVLILVSTERAGTEQDLSWVLSHNFVGLATAAPFALRILGEVVRGLLLFALRLGVALGLVLGLERLFEAGLVGGAQRHVALELIIVLFLMLALGPGARWLGSVADFVVLRQDNRWRKTLQKGLEGLDPERGLETLCCQAADRLSVALRLRGVAVWIDGVDEPVTRGEIEIESMRTAWLKGAAETELPKEVFDVLWIRDPELQRVMLASRVTWVVPLVSPQRRWGHLFVSAGLLGHAASHSKLEVLRDFGRQLALRLDVADLLARAVAAERELARGEKLAALGETAARLAHEIRNPVAAARSLAQMLAAEPTSPLNAEHAGLVVRELDRVERQVRAMLELTRQEVFRFRALRLDDWVHRTLDELDCCKSLEGIAIEVEVEEGLEIRADGERLRQALVNLLTNAGDALARGTESPRLWITARSLDEGAQLTVRDNGPGIADAVRARLFEPFVSTKARGTGLGLAIARRIVEAHGGRIGATTDAEGTELSVWLPSEPAPSGTLQGSLAIASTRLEVAAEGSVQ